MEEILASIRRIIAEGEREAQLGAGPEEGAETADILANAAPAVETKPPGTPEPEVLVLTQMVQDDGSVVSLQSDAVSAAVGPAVDVGLAANAEPDKFPELGQPEILFAAAVERVETSFGAAAESPPEPAAAFALTPVDPYGAPPRAAESTGDERPDLPPPTTPTAEAPIAEERIAVPVEGSKKPEIVSEEALAASTAALSQLAQSVTRMREPAPGQSKTVDDVVREAVEPMLKQWLDANLSRIVERMVREAIDRVVRRVE